MKTLRIQCMRIPCITLIHVNHIDCPRKFQPMTTWCIFMVDESFKAVAFTDFHGSNEAFDAARNKVHNGRWNCVIVAGDIVNHDYEQAKKRLVELAEIPLFFVPGNMDDPALASWTGTELVRPLHGIGASLGNVILVGLGGSPKGPFSTPFQISEESAVRILNKAVAQPMKGPLILVSHCPPRGTKLDIVSSGEHVGSAAVRNFVDTFRPALVISGHVHEAKGVDMIGGSTVVNTGPAFRGNYAEVRIGDKVTVSLESFRG